MENKTPLVAIGNLISSFDKRNDADFPLPFMGVDKTKTIVPTVANTESIDRKKYKIIQKGQFVFSGMQTGRDICIRIALCDQEQDVLLSPAYTTFKVNKSRVLPEYFMMNFLSDEMDRIGWFKSDSSVRSNLDWDRFCEIQIPLPSIEDQQAYVDAYKGYSRLVEENERLVEELEKAAQACILECRSKYSFSTLGALIEETDNRNTNGTYDVTSVRGVSINKEFIDTKADMTGVSLAPYKVVDPNAFSYVTVTSRNGGKISLAMNSDPNSCIVSSSYATFRVKADAPLLPEYLFLLFKRPEFDRYSRFNSWGSARETFNWDDMCRVKIPLPPIDIQKSIAALYHCTENARRIAEEAREQLKLLCPALIQHAVHQG